MVSKETAGSAFLERARKVENPEYEHDLIKTIDYFIDDYRFSNSSLVTHSMEN